MLGLKRETRNRPPNSAFPDGVRIQRKPCNCSGGKVTNKTTVPSITLFRPPRPSPNEPDSCPCFFFFFRKPLFPLFGARKVLPSGAVAGVRVSAEFRRGRNPAINAYSFIPSPDVLLAPPERYWQAIESPHATREHGPPPPLILGKTIPPPPPAR